MTGTAGATGRVRTAGSNHLARLSRVYSHETWSLYEQLDRSLDPRGPDWLHARAGEHLTPGSVVLDAGCRDGAHLIRLVQAHDVVGVGVEPVAIHVERARAAVAAAGLQERIQIVHATMEDCAFPDEHFDFVWCRDVLEQVEPLVPFLQGAARVLKSKGRILVYTTVATVLLEPGEAAMLGHHLGNVEPNLVEGNIEAAFDCAGLTIEDKDVIGTEWREYAEERTQPVSRALLRLARLRRERESVVASHGEDIYRHVEANLHWEAFQLLGKLRSIVYLLRHHQR
ncbi:MAG: class I SAM-dependent methyltransferase [Chloroflexota bacterium]|nr:class I SAM-dependent methyltransferase [Chloroflexota bacterium]